MYTRTYSTLEGDFELVAPCDQRRFNRSKLGSILARRSRKTQILKSRVIGTTLGDLAEASEIMSALLLPFDKIKEAINNKYRTNSGTYEIKELKLLHKLRRPFRSLLAMVNPSLSSFLRPHPELEVYIYIRIFIEIRLTFHVY